MKHLFILANILLLANLRQNQEPYRFVESLYRDPIKWDAANDLYAPNAAHFFTPELLRMMRQAAHAPNGEVGRMDYMPLCACQDSDGMILKDVRVTQSGNQAKAMVTLLIGAQTIHIGLELVRFKSGWRITDIANPDPGYDIPSLRHWLSSGP